MIEIEKKKDDKNWFGLIVLGGLFVLVLLTVHLAWPGLSIKVDITTVGNVLAPVVLTALFIERAVEVMISPWRDPGAEQKALKLADAKNNVAAVASQQAAANDLSEYKGKTRRYAFAFALLLGTAAAIVGVRCLWPFLNDPYATYVAAVGETKMQGNPINDSKADPRAKEAFIAVDVVLSALLLAGGANGVHWVVTSFTSFFDNNAQNNQGAPS